MINSHVLPKVFAVSIPEGGGLDSNQQHPDLYELLLKSRTGFIDLALCQLSCHRHKKTACLSDKRQSQHEML